MFRFAASLSAVTLAWGCNASIGGNGGGGGDDEVTATDAGDLAMDASQQNVSTDAGGGADAAAPCDAIGDDRVRDPDSGACYYYFSAAPLASSAAQDACVALGGHLAFIGSADESVLIGTIAPGDEAAVAANLQDIWVGGTDSPTEGAWHWIDGTAYYDDVAGEAIEFVNWRGVEPNNSVGQNPDGENCMIIEGDNNLVDRGPQWDDRNCLAAFPYICEVP